MSDIHSGTLRLISQELLDWALKAYPAPDISANTPEVTIKWQAAQHEVVKNLIAKANTKQSTVGPTGAVVRMGS